MLDQLVDSSLDDESAQKLENLNHSILYTLVAYVVELDNGLMFEHHDLIDTFVKHHVD